MYRGFKLDINEWFCKQLGCKTRPISSFMNGESCFDYYYKTGNNLLSKNNDQVKTQLEKFIIGNDGELDGTAIQNDWFPQINCDIFISHSHKDEDLAIALAGWLNDKFGLKSFIDFCIWGYVDDLLQQIDDRNCYQPTNRICNYTSRYYYTSHVHMMLNMALMQMIDKTECLFFLNTPNSISLSDIETRTLSPWIYSEIGISQMIEKKELQREKPNLFSKKKEFGPMNEFLKTSYKVDLSHLTEIDIDNLCKWNECKFKGTDALDELYKQNPAPQKK